MDERMKEALASFLEKVIQGIESAGQFTYEQVPDVVQQALTWFMIESLLLSSWGVLILLFVGWLGYLVYREDGLASQDSGWYTGFPMIGGSLALTGVIIIMSNLTWLKILVAPKWFIVTELSKLIN